jgi:alpha-galactosidase
MIRNPLRAGLVAFAVAAAVISPHAAINERLAQVGAAFVDLDRAAERWTIGNDAIASSVRLARGRTLVFEGLFIGRSDDALGGQEGADALITVNGTTYRLGAPGSPFTVEGIDAEAGADFVSLAVRFTSRLHPVVATRRYVVYQHAPAIETWTDFEIDGDQGGSVAVENLNAFALTVHAGPVEWVSGLEPTADDGPSFSRLSRSLGVGERLTLGSPVLSSLRTVPYFSIGNGHRRFFAGLAWSGEWSVSLDRVDDAIAITADLPAMSALVDGRNRVEGPHAIIAVAPDRPGSDIAGLSQLVYDRRSGRPFPALTTFNTWFLHGTNIDQDIIRADIDHASSIGVELFQLDAGWYPGDSRSGRFDFTTGLGSWRVDGERFPLGLRAMRDYAHGRGMKFGVWVEPERIDLQMVGRAGLSESFLAQHHGRYDPGLANADARDAQICLAHPLARAWVLSQLTQFIDEIGPDNLKWDLNRWVSCTREGHGHPTNGGNYEHTRALYEILSSLRQRYPAMSIENCAGGARRIDFAMARLTDAAWMDDRTAPAAHVRYNLDGLLAAFPAGYLFSYVMPHPDEPIQGSEDIAMLVRSRMPGTVGITADLGSLAERELNELTEQLGLAKRLRDSLGTTTTYTLTPQARDLTGWRVIQEVSQSTGSSVIFAYANQSGDAVRVMLRDINRDAIYELRSADRGRLGRLNGADLVDHGLEIRVAPESSAQVLILEPVASAGRVK